MVHHCMESHPLTSDPVLPVSCAPKLPTFFGCTSGAVLCESLSAHPPWDCGEMLEINRPQPAWGVAQKVPVEPGLNIDSWLQNDRLVFGKTGQVFFVYTVTCKQKNLSHDRTEIELSDECFSRLVILFTALPPVLPFQYIHLPYHPWETDTISWMSPRNTSL